MAQPHASDTGSLSTPVAGIGPGDLTDTFNDRRGDGTRMHEGIDIMAPAGTPVLAAAAETIEKLFVSDDGGNTIYIRLPDRRTIHYYAHVQGLCAGVGGRTAGSTGAATRHGRLHRRRQPGGPTPPLRDHGHKAGGELVGADRADQPISTIAGRRHTGSHHPGMDVVQLLGENVRYYRKLKGMTQEQLALEAEMERSYVSDLERGQRNPSVRALGRLAAALNVQPHALLLNDHTPS